jgi:hypothetical protein
MFCIGLDCVVQRLAARVMCSSLHLVCWVAVCQEDDDDNGDGDDDDDFEEDDGDNDDDEDDDDRGMDIDRQRLGDTDTPGAKAALGASAVRAHP